MKISRCCAVLAALVMLPLVHAALPTQSQVDAGKDKISIAFPGWEHYSDLQGDYQNSPDFKRKYLKQLIRSFDELAGRKIPKGEHLALTFKDIHLAGVYTLHQGRVPYSLHPPHLIFSYVLTGADGHVIKSGDADIKNDDYSVRITSLEPGDPRHFENDVLRVWMESDLLK